MYAKSRFMTVLLTVGAALTGVTGCGGGGDGGPLPPADVAIQATMTTAPNEITAVVVRTTAAGDRIDVSNATARVERADGTAAAVSLTTNAEGTEITLGRATVTPSATQFNALMIRGPIRLTDGATGTITIIGRLEFKFEVLPNGTVVGPRVMTVNIPTRGAATDRRVILTGLNATPPDYVKTIIRDQRGGITESAVHAADAQGRVVLRDAHGNITAETLSGNDSRITIMFARTDTDADGVPNLF